jgi:MoxR-like ATPase
MSSTIFAKFSTNGAVLLRFITSLPKTDSGRIAMFDSLEDLSGKLASTGYFIDPVMIQVVFLAAKLQKPLLLEGPTGSGKTQLALSVAAAAKTHVERLQCYRGVTEEKAIGQFYEGLQRLYMEFSKGQHASWQEVQGSLKGRDFFRPGPLMRARSNANDLASSSSLTNSTK